MRIPYVPKYNDNQIAKIGASLSDLKNIIKVRVLPYHNYADSKYESLNIKNTLPETLTTDEKIKSEKQILKAYGLNVCD